MKLVDRFQRWNKWRKHSMNSRLYKFLVLLGLRYSPTLALYRTKKEERINKEKFDEIKRKYWDKIINFKVEDEEDDDE